ncbi:hypothetical protein [Ureibacillus chungkukjangi]
MTHQVKVKRVKRDEGEEF